MSTKRVKSLGLVRSDEGRKGFLFKTNVILLLALIMIIFVVPVLPRQRELLISTLLCILVISGLYAADFSRTAFRILFTTGTLVILVTVANLLLPDIQNLNPLTFLFNTLFFIVVTVALVVHVARAREVDRSTLLSAINSYLLIGLSLSILFVILDLFVPGSFAQVDAPEAG
ncbi:MAG: hypothetical protein U9R60_15355, partial [Bacteroidota bacterium]|nr:hypothetical protein [Bacteroidota bacterium]